MVKRSSAAYLLFFLLLAVLFAPHDAAAAGKSPRNVLLLTSYHQGDRWDDSVVQGVREALGSLESVSLSIENLDMRRYTDQEHTRMTTAYIRAKYQGRPQDLVLVSDDPALNFLLTVRNDLFPNTPVVFCGINNFTPQRIQGQSNITGVNETLSLEATLRRALKLFPETTRIMAVVSDTEASGRTNLEQYRAAAARIKGRVQFDELLNMTSEYAPDILSRLPKDTLVLRLINLLKPEGGYLSIQDSIRILSAHAPVPVFTAWSFDLGDGALGGYVSSGQDQGRAAGNLANRILKGEGADQIPVVMESPNVPMFDYKVMERFGIEESALPKGSVVLNHQESIWEQYWGWLLGFALFCGLQTYLILALLTRGKRLHAANAALRESEHFTISLLEAIPVPVFYKGKDGRYQGFNMAFLNLYGKNKDELIGKSVFDITSPELAKVYHAKDMELFENPGTQIYPYTFKTAHGDLRDVIFHKASLTDEHGVVTGLIGAILDLTEQKRAEEALRESERRLADVIEFLPDATLAINRDKRIIVWNKAIEEMTGISSTEMIGQGDYAYALPFYGERRPQLMDLVFEDSAETAVRYPAITRKGDSLTTEVFCNALYSGRGAWVLLTVSPLYDVSGQIFGAIESIRDITERKQAEERIRASEARLRESEHHFRTLANNDLALIWTSGPDKLCNYFNEPWLRYTGRTLEQELGNGWAEGVHPEDADRCLNIYVSHFDRREPFSMEYRLRKANGEYGWILDSGTPRYDSEGNFTGYIGYCYDITERKRAEEENKILNAQLQQAQKLEAIGTLAGGIAHDFNNILGAIIGYSEIIRDDLPPGSPGTHPINQVLKASHRAKDLVKQILAFSRQAEGLKIPMEPAGIVKETIALLRSSLPTTITIEQVIDPDAGMVLADPTQMHQIVMNLCTNAFHAMEVKGGTLTISLQKIILCQDDLATEPDLQPGTFVQLSVRDTGEGILPEIRKRIFDPFFTTKEVGKGTGLGLSMVYSIVKSSGGSIACDSRLGKGTEFRILLPSLEGQSEKESGSTDLIPHGKENILLIDDEEMLVELGQAMLEHLGYQVTTRTSSLEALTTFQNDPHQFDAVITDQTMPGMTGIDLARRLLQIRPELPIILCTGYSNLVDEAQAKAYGIKGFAMKPLTKKEIAALLKAAMTSKE